MDIKDYGYSTRNKEDFKERIGSSREWGLGEKEHKMTCESEGT